LISTTPSKRLTRRSSFGRSKLRRLAWRYMFENFMKFLAILLICISTGCGNNSMTIASLDGAEGTVENSFSTLIGKEYLAIFYLELGEADVVPDYCRVTYKELNEPCGILLDNFEIDISMSSNSNEFKGNLKTMVTSGSIWSSGTVTSYKDAAPQDKFYYKQPFMRQTNKGMGWLIGKIETSNFDRLESIVKFKVKGKEWIQFKPRIVLVTLDEILDI